MLLDALMRSCLVEVQHIRDFACGSCCLSWMIKAIVSAATFGLWEEAFDLRFQNRRKSSRGPREPRLWLHDQDGGLSGTNQPGKPGRGACARSW